MNILKPTFCSLLLLGATSCAQPSPPSTPSGNLEFTFQNIDVSCIKSNFLNAILDSGRQIKNVTDWQMVFEKPTSNLMAQMFLSSRAYSTVNERVTITTTSNSKNSVRFVMTMALVTNPGSSFEKLTNNPATAKDQEGMESIFRQLEIKCRIKEPDPAPGPQPTAPVRRR